MTREEAIKIIQNEYKCVDRECDIERSCGKCPYMMPTKEPILEAYKMAIQALSQEPCDDAISRQVAIDTIESWLSCDDYNETERHIMRAMQSVLYDLPSVTPKSIVCDDAISREWLMRKATERFYTTNYFNHISAMIEEAPPVTQKSGKWIRVTDKTGHLVWECDKCSWQQRFNTNFCPDCGACMREGRTLDEFIEDSKESEDKE